MHDQEKYDGIVIGAGQGGKPLAVALAQAGWRTALIERQHVGGTCVNVGCTPTKTMAASARVAYLARRAADYGVNNAGIDVDMAAVRSRKQTIVESFRDGSLRSIQNTANLDLLMGEASFTGPKTLAVTLNTGGTAQLNADKIFINTGGRSLVPDIPGLDGVPFLDSTSIMEINTLPEHLIVLGGGYIGLEFGQMFRRFGCRVTIVQRGEQLFAREDSDVAAEVARIMREDGIEVLLQASALGVTKGENGTIALRVDGPEGERLLNGSHFLVATGRIPNTDTLNLAAAGVEVDPRGFVKTNDRLETTVPGIFALGDVKGGPAFTHISYDDYRILRSNLLDGGNASRRDRFVPYTVFIDPQLGRVGLSEDEARASGRRVRIAKMPMAYVARALEMDEPRGFMKAVVDADSEQILGGAILGIEGGELMAMLQIAMMGHLPYTALRDGIFAHPTLAEAFNNLFATLA